MTDASHHLSFASGISLDPSWPNAAPENMSVIGLTRFAACYIEAAEHMLFNTDDVSHPMEFYLGPTLQLTGLAAELTFKTLLQGGGYSEKQTRKFGHSSYDAYLEARSFFDELQFLSMVAYSCENYMPEKVRSSINQNFGTEWPDGWNTFSPQIGILDLVYDRPFRSRYHSEGVIFLPVAFVIILGVKTLLSTMLERVGDDRLPGSLTPPSQDCLPPVRLP